jgi:hypothetical protein
MADFLGTGVAFPLAVDERGWLGVVSAERDIEEAIRIILFTGKGERVMRPGFGSGLPDFVFSTMTVANLGTIQSAVFQALVTWEPRIKVLEVTVRPDAHTTGRLNIGVSYRVRATNSIYNRVFPFYLKRQ